MAYGIRRLPRLTVQVESDTCFETQSVMTAVIHTLGHRQILIVIGVLQRIEGVK